MPDGIDLKRIIDLDPETTVTDDDYTIVDSTTGGAKKFALGQALGEIKDGLQAVEDDVTDLKEESSNINTSITPKQNPFLNADILDFVRYYNYTAKNTSSWQGNYPPKTYDLSAGEMITIALFDYYGCGTQKVRLRFLNASDGVVSEKYPTVDSDGNVFFSMTAPETTAKVLVSVWTISSGETPVVGTTYHFRNMILIKGSISIKNLNIDGRDIEDQSILYKSLSLALKPHAIGVRYGVRYPNFNTSDSTLTFYAGTVILDRQGNEIIRTNENIAIVVTSITQLQYVAYDLVNSTFVCLPSNTNFTKTTQYIVLGIIEGRSGKGWIGIQHTINGFNPYEDPGKVLPTNWESSVQTIQTAQKNTFIFAIQTDTHYALDQNPYYGDNLKVLTNYIGFDFVANLGDVVRGYADETIDSDANTKAAMTQIMHRYITDISCPFLIARGNHDNNIMWADAGYGDRISKSELWGRLFKPIINTNKKIYIENGKMYYYVDFDLVRVVVLDTNGRVDSGYNEDYFGVSPEQVEWFAQKALDTTLPVLVLSHVPLIDGWSVESNYHASFANIVSALQSFKTNGGTVIGCMSGHTHKQEDKTVDGLLYVTFRNQADLAEAVMIDLDTKTINTISVGFSGNRSFTFA